MNNAGVMAHSADQFKTVQQGASTSVLLATSPLLTRIGGRYFADNNETDVLDRRSGTLHGVARYALDPANAPPSLGSHRTATSLIGAGPARDAVSLSGRSRLSFSTLLNRRWR